MRFCTEFSLMRFFWLVVNLFSLGLAIDCWTFVNAAQTEIKAGFFYSDTKALIVLLLMVCSLIFFYTTLTKNFWVIIETRVLEMIAKCIDIFWYPLGLLAALLAFSGSENANLTTQNTFDAARYNTTYSSMSRFHSGAVEACAMLKASPFILGEIVIEPENSDAVNGRHVLNVCKHRLFRSGRQRLFSMLPGFSERSMSFAIRETVSDLSNKCMELPGFHKVSFGSSIETVRFSSDFNYGKVRVDNVRKAYFDVRGFCALVVDFDELGRKLSLRGEVIEERDGVIPNPWLWLCGVSVLVGLKLTKTVVEIGLKKQR